MTTWHISIILGSLRSAPVTDDDVSNIHEAGPEFNTVSRLPGNRLEFTVDADSDSNDELYARVYRRAAEISIEVLGFPVVEVPSRRDRPVRPLAGTDRPKRGTPNEGGKRMNQRTLTRNPIPSHLRAAAKHLRDAAEPAPQHAVPNDESAAEFDAAAAGIDTALISELSNRGFAHFPKIPGLYGGTARVYESSLATTEAIWLSVEDVPTGNGSKPTSEATIHLSIPNALALAAQIIDLAHAAGWWLDQEEPMPLFVGSDSRNESDTLAEQQWKECSCPKWSRCRDRRVMMTACTSTT